MNGLFNLFLEGSALGLAMGVSCAAFCIPVLIGISVRDEKNRAVSNLLLFLAGRLIAYVLFAVVLSIVGEKIKGFKIDHIVNPAIGAALIYWGLRFLFKKDSENADCGIRKYSSLTPFLMGVITGISPCPPFIAAGFRVLSLGTVPGGVVFFLGFYLITSVFLFPALLTVFLKFKKEIKIIAGFVSIIFGLIYFVSGIFSAVIYIGGRYGISN